MRVNRHCRAGRRDDGRLPPGPKILRLCNTAHDGHRPCRKLERFADLWSPRIVARYNGDEAILVKVKGDERCPLVEHER
jgi:hypothetical protein